MSSFDACEGSAIVNCCGASEPEASERSSNDFYAQNTHFKLARVFDFYRISKAFSCLMLRLHLYWTLATVSSIFV
jgi:hypothetical protein